MKKLFVIFFTFLAVGIHAGQTDTTYICGVDGKSGGSGTKASPYDFATLRDNILDTITYGRIIALSDTAYYGSLELTNVVFTAANMLEFITWNKYGDGKAVIRGTKPLTGWSSAGTNLWTKYDSDLPNTEYFTVDYGFEYGGDDKYFFLNGLFINGVWYHNSQTPNSGYYDIESVAGDNKSYFTDTDLSLSTNEKQFAFVYIGVEDWVGTKAKVLSNTTQTVYTRTTDFYGSYDMYHGAGLKYKFVNDDPDQVGEWSYDYSTQTVTLYHTTNPSSLTIYAPIEDYLLRIYNSSYIKLTGIGLDCANMYPLLLDGVDEIYVDTCYIDHGGYSGAQVIYYDDVYFTGDTIVNCNSNGIVFADGMDGGTRYVHDCCVGYLGESETYGDVEGWNYTGILSIFDLADGDYKHNEIKHVGYNGIALLQSGAEADGTEIIETNYIHNWTKHLNDGAAIYVWADDDNVSKIIRKNFVYNQDTDVGFVRYDLAHKMGIYLDVGSDHWLVDSNTVYNVQASLFNNWNASDNTFNNNICVDQELTNGNVDYQAGLFKEGNADYAVDNLTFEENIIVVTDDDESMAITWSHDGSPAYNSDVDGNYYFNPFRTANNYIAAGRTGGERTFYQIEPTNTWYSFIGFDQNTTYNQADWEFGDVSGITEDEFVWLFANWSGSTHQFDLGDCTFKDTIGSNVSGSLSVPAYKSKVLFYASGNLSTVDDPFYSPYEEEYGPASLSGLYEVIVREEGSYKVRVKGSSYYVGEGEAGTPIEGLSDNLISWYDFQGNADDRHGSNNGTVYGATNLYPSGWGQGYCYYYDGTDDRIQFPAIAMGGNTGTISFWARASDDARTWDVAFSRSSLNDYVVLWSTGDWGIGINDAAWVTDPGGKDEEWHMFTLVYDGTLGSANLKFYVDGVSVGTPANYTTNWANEASVWHMGCSDGSANYWNGYIDSAGMWTDAKDSDDVSSLYNSSAGVYYYDGEFYPY